MSSFPFPSLIAVALSVMTYSLLQREWGLAILMGVISLLLFILLVLVSRQRQNRGEGSITPFILSIGKAVPAYLFLFVFVGLGFALYHKNWILSLEPVENQTHTVLLIHWNMLLSKYKIE